VNSLYSLDILAISGSPMWVLFWRLPWVRPVSMKTREAELYAFGFRNVSRFQSRLDNLK